MSLALIRIAYLSQLQIQVSGKSLHKYVKDLKANFSTVSVAPWGPMDEYNIRNNQMQITIHV